jgi:hypothetical protein
MRYVIIRDDDTNALTPVGCLERLYRPFLKRGLPVNLAVIPAVTLEAHMANGKPEGFLLAATHDRATERLRQGPRPLAAAPDGVHSPTTIPLAVNPELVSYLRQNQGFHVVQHGCHHDFLEFDRADSHQLAIRLDRGTQLLVDAGLPRPRAFVAPYDRLSRAGAGEVSRRFQLLSTGWFELRRLPFAWWPKYVLKKLRQAPHWRVNGTLLLSHPGCLLSYQRSYSTMLGGILHHLKTQKLTVLVTHWWEYFRDGKPDEPFIEFLHETAAHLSTCPDIKVISFSDLIDQPSLAFG